LVFAELHAAAIRDTVSFANMWTQFDEAGELLQGKCSRKIDDRAVGRVEMVGNRLTERA
jgi:hypothetical protein